MDFRFFLFLFEAITLNFVLAQTPAQRNTEWLEDQIDSFLTQAQNNGDPTDIQVSSCKISGQQLVATAQATIARVLKGVCNTNNLEDKFQNLENQLGDQLNVIKTMIISLEDKVIELDQSLKRGQKRVGNFNTPQRRSTEPVQEQSYTTASTFTNYYATQNEDEQDESANEGLPMGGGPRYDEIVKYNSTVSVETGRRVFSYYWIVPGMSYKIRSWNLRRTLRSSSFYIYPGGYRFYLKMIPRSSTSTLHIHPGLTKGDFDDSLTWPFTLKLRLSVLSVEDETGTQDLKSRVWDPRVLCSGSNWMKPTQINNPECLGLGMPHDVIKSSEYLYNDRIIIKLSVYLD